MKHFISLKYFSKEKLLGLIELAVEVKNNPLAYRGKLKDKHVGLFFQKPSLRTKTSFYVGALELGANGIYYAPDEVKIGEREKVSDVAKTVSQYLDAIVLRTFSHQVIEEFAQYSTVPVINALSGLFHPSQVLGDLLTLRESKIDIKKVKFTYIGDGNNVCHSLLHAFSILGGNITVVTPRGYGPDKIVLKECRELAEKSGAAVSVSNDPREGVKGTGVLYTDVWTSMGKEKEREFRKKVFKNFQINDKLIMPAEKNCLIMHCLPAHRGEEITDSVIDGINSVVFTQAKNRLHSAKAILLYALGGEE